ncbi:MAG: cupin domain-containing protein [Crocinitomicaceae bacterium]|nr:cupin domain-containing protein [Crocinitomicaceae bacterium]
MTAQDIIEKFDLQAHPEGGFYAETYRSDMSIPEMDRQLMTSIYFLLPSSHVSHFHRIKSDELWFFHAGSPLIVHTLDENGHTEHLLGNDVTKGEQAQILVKGNTIFGSSVVDENAFSFVSCVVAPGFDFNDFELFKADELLAHFPNEKEIIERLT